MLLTSVLKNLVRRPPKAASDTPGDERIAQALAARESGDVNRALDIVRGILSRQPDHAEARYLAGLWLAQEERHEEALPHLRRAAELMSANPDVRLALGNVYKARNDAREAEAHYRQVIVLAPHNATGHYHLALVLKSMRRTEAALEHARLACAFEPYIEDARKELVLILSMLECYDEALEAAKSAVRNREGSAVLWACAAMAHRQLFQLTAARECLGRAVALGLADVELQTRMGMLLHDLGDCEAARQAYDKALASKPGYELARFHRALGDLAQHRYQDGWEGYELRLISEDRSCPAFANAAWRGEPLEGKSVLVHGEQGLGDEIMFASCFGEVTAAASRSVLTCNLRLAKLFRRSFPAAEIVTGGPQESGSIADVDFEVAAGSLPRYLRCSAVDFPRHAGYLRADPERVAYWRDRLAALGPGLKVGISWQGGTHKTRAPLRSLPLAAWAPIFGVPRVRFVSLQYGEVNDIATAPVDIAHWTEAIDDYDETAALVGALDLVVSVCTAVIHLTGALGRPVWVMAPFSPEWRYGATGDRMHWYPSSRLFRQRTLGDWEPVVTDVAAELRRAADAA